MSVSPQLAYRVRGASPHGSRLVQATDRAHLLAADDRHQVAGGVRADGRLIGGVEQVGGEDDDAQGDAQQDIGNVGQVGLGNVRPAAPQRVSR